jgi:hypothetical protein
MRDSRETNRKKQSPAGPARREGVSNGAPHIVMGRTGKVSADAADHGAADVTDPKAAADITEIADQVHANA